VAGRGGEERRIFELEVGGWGLLGGQGDQMQKGYMHLQDVLYESEGGGGGRGSSALSTFSLPSRLLRGDEEGRYITTTSSSSKTQLEMESE